MKKVNIAKQQNEHLAAALAVAAPADEHVSARAGRAWFRVKPENVEVVSKRLLGAHRQGVSTAYRHKEGRSYPFFDAGRTTTREYIEQYHLLNHRLCASDFSHADHVAPIYADGALDFDPVEEHEQDAAEAVADLL